MPRSNPHVSPASCCDRKSAAATSLFVVIFVALAASVMAQGILTESFTYQGRLFDEGSAVNGVYDFEFKLYDRADFSTGLQVGSAVIVDDTTVWDGLFAVELDFGAALYTGNEVWLQVALREGTSTGPYTGLDPRQKMTAAPFATLALDADRLGGYDASSYSLVGHPHSGTDITSGTVSAARIDGTIARDSEIMPTVLANDGSSSGLDADYLDGSNSTSFARKATSAKAYGYVSEYSGLISGSFNVDSAVWSDTYDRYEITITDMYFNYNDIAVVTSKGDAGSCPAGTVARHSSVSGKLLVYHVNLDGTNGKCSFSFVVFAGT